MNDTDLQDYGEVIAPDGTRGVLRGPKGASPDQVRAAAMQLRQTMQQQQSPQSQPTPAPQEQPYERTARIRQQVEGARQRYIAQQYPGTRSMAMEALPVGGAILGGMAGGPAAPITAGLGAGIGEEAAQLAEMFSGKRPAPSVPGILRMGAEQGAMEWAGGPVLRTAGKAVGNLMKAGGTKLVEAFMPRNMREAGLVQAYRAGHGLWERALAGATGESGGPRTLAQTIAENRLWGTEAGLGVRALKAQRNLWNNMIQPALTRTRDKINIPKFFDEVEADIIKENPEAARQGDLIKALNSLRDTYRAKNINDVTYHQLQKFKEGWAEFVPQKYYRGEDVSGAFNEVKALTSDLARLKIYDKLGPDVKQAYLDYSNLYNVVQHGKSAMTRQLKVGGTGTVLAGLKDAAMTPVSTIGSKVLYKTADGLELVGEPGARFVRDIIPGVPEVGQPLAAPPPTPLPPPKPLQLKDQPMAKEQ